MLMNTDIESGVKKRRFRRRSRIGIIPNCLGSLGLLLLCASVTLFVIIVKTTPANPNPNPYIHHKEHEFNYHDQATKAKNLVIVACHGIAKRSAHRAQVTIQNHNLLDLSASSAAALDEDWHLLPYQQNSGVGLGILLHIEAGIAAAELDPHALLLFSGGQTRRDAGPGLSEAASYYTMAEELNFFESETEIESEVSSRMATEEVSKMTERSSQSQENN
jgi:hypothetical protein